jgi:crotonobetainyl-CoA:carnitine CoA-transferase CaiB-like acyl-CoA transferase
MLCGTRAARKTNSVRLQQLMSEWSVTRLRRDVFESAQHARVACFPVNTAEDVLADAQLAHRRFSNTLRSSTGATRPIAGLPFHVTASDGDKLQRGQEFGTLRLGEANAEIYHQWLDLSEEQIEMLRRDGVV